MREQVTLITYIFQAPVPHEMHCIMEVVACKERRIDQKTQKYS